jgi:hypothetical protein
MLTITQQAQLLEFFKLVPANLLPDAVIAGGACVDLEKAGDVDIWLMNQRLDDAETLRDILMMNFNQFANVNDVFSPGWDNNIQRRRPVERERYMQDGLVLVEGFFEGRPFQILLTAAQNWNQLLSMFDLSVHKAAIDPAGRTLNYATAPDQVIRVTNFHSPERTFARLRKLCKRYGTTPKMEDLWSLALQRTE